MAGVLLVAANLRAPITSVGPLIGEIRAAIGFSSGAAGLLTALPLLAFAGLSPLAPVLARRLGLERALFYALLLLAAGVLVRSSSVWGALFAGTFVAGLAIALGNVLLPSLVKRDFAARAGLVTGLYTATMSSVAALASGVSVPLAEGLDLGWRGAIGLWAIPALLVAALWTPRLRLDRRPSGPSGERGSPPGLLRSALAWQVTLFMGLQAAIFYVAITWLPVVMMDSGLTPARAGWMVSLMQLVSIPAAFAAPVLAERMPSQSLMLACAAGLSGAGFVGMLVAGNSVLPWMVLLGLGQGSCISLALTLFSLRAPNAGAAAGLSGMAQSAGYLLAAAGPPLFGVLYDTSGSWKTPLIAMVGVSALLAVAGLGAGRDLRVSGSRASPRER